MRVVLIGSLILAIGALVLVASLVETDSAVEHQNGATVYRAKLNPLNATAARSSTEGQAEFRVEDDELTIAIDVRNAPPGMEHWQHFHGFEDDRTASCPTPSADTNGDGFIDLIETEPVSGTTMVPFNADPVALEIVSTTYPSSDSAGNYSYRVTVSLSALESAFAKEFGGAELDLHRRIVYIHGVPESVSLPATVESLDPIPAQTTLPIACGKINRVVW